jgi:hypothetical protein
VDAATREGTRTRRLRRVAVAAVQRLPREEVEVRKGGLVGRWDLNLKAPGVRDGACWSILPVPVRAHRRRRRRVEMKGLERGSSPRSLVIIEGPGRLLYKRFAFQKNSKQVMLKQ